ncbi:hypothetical protein, partial [Pedobacter frigidisoli]|uniref:hypothetical protein n=1 Tax=Pedobacter frigidisoli TaxID=2530455 RepID=UPI002931DBFC
MEVKKSFLPLHSQPKGRAEKLSGGCRGKQIKKIETGENTGWTIKTRRNRYQKIYKEAAER